MRGTQCLFEHMPVIYFFCTDGGREWGGAVVADIFVIRREERCKNCPCNRTLGCFFFISTVSCGKTKKNRTF
jgi:hypothetical protein